MQAMTRGLAVRTALSAAAHSCSISHCWTTHAVEEISPRKVQEAWLEKHTHQQDKVGSQLVAQGGAVQEVKSRLACRDEESGGAASSRTTRVAPPPPVTAAAAANAAAPEARRGGRSRGSLRLPRGSLGTSDSAVQDAFNAIHKHTSCINWMVVGLGGSLSGREGNSLQLLASGADALTALMPDPLRTTGVFPFAREDVDDPVYMYFRFNRRVQPTPPADVTRQGAHLRQESEPLKRRRHTALAASRAASKSLRAGPTSEARSTYASKKDATAAFVLITWNPPSASVSTMLHHRRAVSSFFPHHVHLTIGSLAELTVKEVLSSIKPVMNSHNLTVSLEVIPAAALLDSAKGLQRGDSVGSAASALWVRRVQLEVPEGYTLGVLRRDIQQQLSIPPASQRIFTLRRFHSNSALPLQASGGPAARSSAAKSSDDTRHAARRATVTSVLTSPQTAGGDWHAKSKHNPHAPPPQGPSDLVVEVTDDELSVVDFAQQGDTLFVQVVDESVAHLLPTPADTHGGLLARRSSSKHVEELPVAFPAVQHMATPGSPVAAAMQSPPSSTPRVLVSAIESSAGPAPSSPRAGALRRQQSASETMSAVISSVQEAREQDVQRAEAMRREAMRTQHKNILSAVKKLKKGHLRKTPVRESSVPKAGTALEEQDVKPRGPLRQAPSSFAAALARGRAKLKRTPAAVWTDALDSASRDDSAMSEALSSLDGDESLSAGDAVEVASTLSAKAAQIEEEESYLELHMNELHLKNELGSGKTATVYRALWVTPAAEEATVPATAVAAAASGEGGDGREQGLAPSGARFIEDPGVEVAVKRFNYIAAQPPPKLLADFKTEIAAFRALPPHENVVRLIGACTYPGLAIVYELMPQGTVFSALRDPERLDTKQRLALACDCAEGVAHLHRHHWMHRDIKSHNVLLGPGRGRLRAKLGDLGTSRVLEGDAGHFATTEIGTMGYKAPEVAYGDPYSYPADVFSLGVLIFELFAPRDAHRRINIPTQSIPSAKYYNVFQEGWKLEYPEDCDAPEWVLPLVHNCTAADPAERWTASKVAKELAARLCEEGEGD